MHTHLLESLIDHYLAEKDITQGSFDLYQYLSLNQKRLILPIEYEEDISVSIINAHIENHLSKEVLTTEQAKKLILANIENRRYFWHYLDYALIHFMINFVCGSIFTCF